MAYGVDPYTLQLIQEFEGFRPNAYWDVNAYRTGYGSDTLTMPDGSIVPVGQGTSGVTQEDALRDLNRRIGEEFQPRVINAIGGDVWSTLTPQQQAVLNSLTYNYGSLPRSVAQALTSGGDVGAAIMGLAGHNDGINRNRRAREAEIWGGNVRTTSGGRTQGRGPSQSGIAAAIPQKTDRSGVPSLTQNHPVLQYLSTQGTQFPRLAQMASNTLGRISQGRGIIAGLDRLGGLFEGIRKARGEATPRQPASEELDKDKIAARNRPPPAAAPAPTNTGIGTLSTHSIFGPNYDNMDGITY